MLDVSHRRACASHNSAGNSPSDKVPEKLNALVLQRFLCGLLFAEAGVHIGLYVLPVVGFLRHHKDVCHVVEKRGVRFLSAFYKALREKCLDDIAGVSLEQFVQGNVFKQRLKCAVNHTHGNGLLVCCALGQRVQHPLGACTAAQQECTVSAQRRQICHGHGVRHAHTKLVQVSQTFPVKPSAQMGVLVGVKVDRTGAARNVLRHGTSYGAGNRAGRHCSPVVVNGPVFAGNISFYVLCNRVHQANTAHQIGRNTEDGRNHRVLVRHELRIFGNLLSPSFVQTIFQVIQIFSRSFFSLSVVEIIIDLYLVLIHIVIDGIGASAHCGSVEGLRPGAVNIVDVVINRVAFSPPGRSEAYAKPGCRLLCHGAGERFKVAVVLDAAVFFPSFDGPFPCAVFFHVLLQLVNVAVPVFFQ